MYKEEKIIDGILYVKSTPNGEWRMSSEALSKLKEVAKNVRHKACDLLGDFNLDYENHNGLHREIMNIQFSEVKPK